MSALRPAAAAAEQVLSLRKTPGGAGQQYEIKWRGQSETTWEAASRVRRQIPALVRAFEQQQQQQQQPSLQQEGISDAANDADGAADAAMHQSAAGDDSEMRAQVAALMQIVQQQSQQMREQQQQLQQLRASPLPSPQLSPQLASQQAPQPPPQQAPLPAVAPNVAASAAAAAAPQSRFARKEPRAQDLREYDGAAGAKLDAWLDELALASMLYELNAREAVLFAVSRLRGAALQWWLALGSSAQAAVHDTATLTAALRARFQPVSAARTARDELDKLVQGSRSVNDYIADFQRLRTQLPSMAEDDALHAFERGLRRELAVELRKQGVTTVQAAIALVARIGGLLQAGAGAQPGRSATANQMDLDSDDAGAMEDRIARSVLNALQSQGAGGSGLGAKTQTQRGYEDDRKGGSSRGRGAARGGRGGPARFGGRGGGMTYTIPGVPSAIVDQRRTAGQCLRCGSGDHRGMECPNAPSAKQLN
jgi:hypothetical protein